LAIFSPKNSTGIIRLVVKTMGQCGIEPIYIQPILVKNDKVILNVKKIQLMILKSYTFVIVTKTTILRILVI